MRDLQSDDRAEPARLRARTPEDQASAPALLPGAVVTLQRSIGNRATAAILLRQPTGGTATAEAPAETAEETEPTPAEVAAGEVAAALEGMTAANFDELWSAIAAHLLEPAVPKEPTPLAEAFPKLFAADLVTRLGKLAEDERPALVEAVRTARRPFSASELLEPVSAALGAITAVQLAEHWAAIEAHLRAPASPKEPTPLAAAFPALMAASLVEGLQRLRPSEQPTLVLMVQTTTTERIRERVAARAVEALAAFGGVDYKNSWPAIASQIADPKPLPEKARNRTGLQASFTALWEPPLLDELTALEAQGRTRVSAAVEAALVTRIAEAPPETVSDEYARLDDFVRQNIEGGRRGYVACRPALMAKFGSVEGINAYYTKEIVRGVDFLGRSVTVHRTLKERLDAAVALLDATTGEDGRTWGEIARASLRGAGGFNIRENRNSPRNLSDHSFGWAIDLNAPENPNVKSSVFRGTRKDPLGSPVEELTGLDLFGGEEYTAIRAGGTAAEMLPHAASMREASQRYEDAFDSQEALVDALAGYLEGEDMLHQAWMKDDLWPTLERAGAQKQVSERIRMIGDWLQYIWDTRYDQEPFSVEYPTCFPDDVLPETEEGFSLPEDLPDVTVNRIATTLASAHAAFVASRVQKDTDKQKQGDEIPASATGSVGTVAAHGFMDLAPQLVAALRGSDGGNLTWLGVASHTKDFMHFELRSEDQPALTRAAPGEGESEAAEPEDARP